MAQEKVIIVTTQSELEAALQHAGCEIELRGNGLFTASQGSPLLVARAGSAPTVVARESSTPRGRAEWCEYYGVPVNAGIAILFKAVNDDFSSNGHRQQSNLAPVIYAPGSMPEAKDWDGGKQECGYGLHFSPSPSAALQFNSDAKRFVACPVLVSDIAIHQNPGHPSKIKAPRVCAPCFEVDHEGEPIARAQVETAKA